MGHGTIRQVPLGLKGIFRNDAFELVASFRSRRNGSNGSRYRPATVYPRGDGQKNALNPVSDRGTGMGVVATFFARALLVPLPCLPRVLRQASALVFQLIQ